MAYQEYYFKVIGLLECENAIEPIIEMRYPVVPCYCKQHKKIALQIISEFIADLILRIPNTGKMGDGDRCATVLNGFTDFYISARVGSAGAIGTADKIRLERIEIIKCVKQRLEWLALLWRKNLKRKTQPILHDFWYCHKIPPFF